MIICITNQKGGVGKTTTALAMAAALKDRGYRVLFIDADPQGNATDTYKARIKSSATLYDLLFENEQVEECIQKTEYGDIIAGDPLLKDAGKHLDGVSGSYRLKERIEPIRDAYDYILVDTPPSLGALLTNALTACDRVIIPITAERYGIQGMSQLQQTLLDIKKYTNPGLVVDGFLVVRYKTRTNLARTLREALAEVAGQMNTKMYETTIRESTKAAEAQAARVNLFEYAPRSTTALDYDNFMKEFLGGN